MNSPPSRRDVMLAHVFCVFQQMCAIGVYVLGKQVMAVVNVYTFVFLRLMCVVPGVFLCAVIMTRKLEPFKVTRKQLIPIAGSGILGILISQSILFAGLNKSTPTNASIISAPCTPLFTALFSVIRGTDKMNIYKGIGFISAVCGALILLEVENFEFKGTTVGNLMIVGSSLCGAINSLVQKHVLDSGLHPLVVQTYVCLIGTAVYVVGYSPFGLFNIEDWQLPGQVWLYAIIVGILLSAIPWCVGIIALKNTSPMTVSVYVVLQPPLAAFVGVVLLGDTLTLRQVGGSALVLLGLLFVNANPIVEKILVVVRRKLLVPKKEFELLSNVEEGAGEVEMEEKKKAEITADGAGFSIAGEEDEVEYTLAIKGETNDFVEMKEVDINGEVDNKAVDRTDVDTKEERRALVVPNAEREKFEIPKMGFNLLSVLPTSVSARA